MSTKPKPTETQRHTAPAPHTWVEVADGIELATWTRVNPGVESLPLVIVHGGPGLWADHDELIAVLSEVGTVHSYDQRGCGRSRPGPSDAAGMEQSMAATVADLDRLRRHWGHDRWVVLGHSFGAEVALAYAAEHPDQTAAVGYLSGRGVGDYRGPNRIARSARWGAELEAEHARLGQLAERSWVDEVRWRQLQVAPDYAELSVGLEHCLSWATTDLAINYDANAALAEDDAHKIAWASATTCPVFFIHGDLDPRPLSCVVELASHAPLARKRLLQGAGHFSWVEEPDETASVIHELMLAGGASLSAR